MELFPAADEDQWSLIKGVIDECDYYILVIAGRYGSLGQDGTSYTEMEYRYALETGKPIIAFLHKDPGSLPAKDTEKTDAGKEKLEAFRELAKKKTCKYWTTPADLGSVVSRSLINLQRNHQGVGWVRGDQVASEEASAEILRLRKKIDDLEEEIEASQTTAPKGTESLAQGDALFEIRCEFEAKKSDYDYFDGDNFDWALTVTWNEVFYEMSPLMIHEANSKQLRQRFTKLTTEYLKEQVKSAKELSEYVSINSVSPNTTDFETVIVQFSALGLITQSLKSRSVKDSETYWTLTPYGRSIMNRLRAIKKSPEE
ncbi:MAG: DUF4062 domain-containing protein [Halioglobus sp.]